jgi:hypothetical protein
MGERSLFDHKRLGSYPSRALGRIGLRTLKHCIHSVER